LLVATSNYEMPPGAQSEIRSYSATNLANPELIPAGPAALGPLAMADIDGDGDLDLFAGGRFAPGRFPEPVSSTIWRNDKGKLTPAPDLSEPFNKVGLVSGAAFVDLDGDDTPDLVLATEWGPVRLFRNQRGHFEDVTAAWGLTSQTGWWTSVAVGDFDGDGRMDLACGNWGRNSIYQLYQPTAFRLYYGDWNGVGGLQMMEAWRSGTNWFPIHDRTWLARGLPELLVRFPTHEPFARANVSELLGAPSTGSGLAASAKTTFLEATQLASMVFLNRGKHFDSLPLPLEAQLTPVFAINVADLDGDGVEDLFLGQNFFGTACDISRDDGGRGQWLRGKGDGTFTAMDARETGVNVMGEQRGVALGDFNHDARVDLAVSQNNAPTLLYLNQNGRRGLRVVLHGPAANPDAVGAKLRLLYEGGRPGPCRTIQAGAGYWSQDAGTPVLGRPAVPATLWVRWPGGKEQTVALKNDDWQVEITFRD